MSEKKQPSFLHRPGDLPRTQLMASAERAVLQYGGSKVAEVHFKFTCSFCGARCSLRDPNILYASGVCDACQETTEINFGGFSIHIKV